MWKYTLHNFLYKIILYMEFKRIFMRLLYTHKYQNKKSMYKWNSISKLYTKNINYEASLADSIQSIILLPFIIYLFPYFFGQTWLCLSGLRKSPLMTYRTFFRQSSQSDYFELLSCFQFYTQSQNFTPQINFFFTLHIPLIPLK